MKIIDLIEELNSIWREFGDIPVKLSIECDQEVVIGKVVDISADEDAVAIEGEEA